MDTYTILRQFADSWMLLAMVLFFVGVILWTLRPGSARVHRQTAEIPLRNDRLPGADPASDTDRSTER
jgi:cytochrome c oxidase cbb3-type subunit 4